MDKYFIQNSSNEQVGPISPEEFSHYGVNENTMVWKQGMGNWMRAGQISELSGFLSLTPPPFNGNSSSGGNSMGGSASCSNGNNNSQIRPIRPDNNLIWAILSTVCCCLPLGIYAIIQASKVNGLYDRGLYNEAQHMANEAKKWAGIGALIGVIIHIINIIVNFVIGIATSI